MIKRLSLMIMALLLCCGMAWAIPAKPGVQTFSQSDGTTISVELVGDEFLHCFLTEDGLPVLRGQDGDFYYRTAAGITTQRAHNPGQRGQDESAFVQSQRQLLEQPTTPARMRKAARRKVGQTQIPTQGSPRVPIILVDYTDKKMSHTLADFEQQYNTGAKSVLQYFTDQSNGIYTPQYDIYGIYHLTKSRATYGGNDSSGNDKGVALMVCDAIDAAGDDIDWSLYDNDGDGEADVCIVVYAGVGEAQSSVSSSIWPCQWELSSGEYYGDGRGAQTRNNTVIDRFAVFNELAGSNDSGKTMDGIGTFCHEFSHCLGLPDFYCTTYAWGRYGMGHWSLMHSGCYNGGSVDGDTPIGYSAYEKSFMGWVDLIEPAENTHYTLPIFNSKSLESDQAVRITSDLNENEYFILENRRKQGWDLYIPDEGVLITHFTYVASRWEANTPNNETMQLATIIPADGSASSYSENTDLYGRTNHEFTDESSPASVLNMRANGTLASSTGGAGKLGKPVTDIVLNNDRTASFWYMRRPVPQLPTPVMTEAADVTATSFTARWTPIDNDEVTYTLVVNRKVDYSLVMKESFAGFTSNNSSISSDLDKYFTNKGWTGSLLYQGDGCLIVGSRSFAGKLTSPTLDMSESDGKMTLIIKASTHGSDNSGQLTVTMGQQSQALQMTATEQTFVVVFDCAATAGQQVTMTSAKGSRVNIYDIEIYSGDASGLAYAAAFANESGDASNRVITGITGTHYTVTGLEPDQTYFFKVKAVPVNVTEADESEWSNVLSVVLNGDTPITSDVTGDGIVDVADINAVINIILGKAQPGDFAGVADVSGDGNYDVADINLIIAAMLN